jgi:hypothetical protein
MKKIVINPDYEYLRKYIETVPEKIDSLGKVIDFRRNLLREDEVANTRLVIKLYRRIYLPNKIRYTFFGASKAKRAYDYANILLERGFNTPTPIAYIEVLRYGLYSKSYFISEYTDLPSVESVKRDLLLSSPELIEELASLTYQLHKKRIYHVDFNIGNILFKRNEEGFEFSLIDNNRMDFGRVSFKKGIKNTTKLGLPSEQLTALVKAYARLWAKQEDEAIVIFRRTIAFQTSIHKVEQFFKKLIRPLRPA